MTPANHAQHIADALGGVPSGAGWKARCPAHDDQRASLSVADRDGNVLVRCHAGCSQDVVITALRERGLWEAPAKAAGKSRKRIVAEYDYQSASGATLFQVVRFDPKGFAQRVPDGDGWKWGLNGTEPVLFRLRQIRDKPSVVVAEGERDVLALEAIGLPATCNPMGAGKWRPSYGETLRGKSVAIIADADAPGRAHAQSVAAALHGVASRVRVLEPPTGKDASDWIEAGATRETILAAINATPEWTPPLEQEIPPAEPTPDLLTAPDGRPIITIQGGALPALVDAAEAALMAAPDHGGLYQRGGQLVRVIRLEADQDGAIRRAAGSPLIVPVETSGLLEAFTSAAAWQRFDARSKKAVSIDCPVSVAATYAGRAGLWNLPPLAAVVDAPTLRRDGSILDKRGYDARTGLLLLGGPFPAIPRSPARDDALAALDRLKSILVGFPFVEPADRSVALSAILTALVRRSLRAAPLHGFTAPTMGTGKSLLSDCVGIIATGRTPPAMSQGGDGEEDRKKLMAALTAGDALLLLDNVERPIEGGTLCSLLTQAEIRDRVLGLTKMVTASTAVTILATGNNLAFRGDMTTRALLCRIDSGIERPEERRFDGDLRALVLSERMELVRAALTILRAYHVADRPPQPLNPYGRFEDWSGWIRAALVWLGEADPCDTRERIERTDDTTAHLGAMLTAWAEHFGARPETVRTATHEPPDSLLAAIMDVAEDRGATINQRRLGKWLVKMDSRIWNGQRFVRGPTIGSRATWRVETVTTSGPERK